MYSSSSSATTHIFSPPRLEVVAEQENADGFPSHARNQFAFYRFLGHQAHRPASAAFRRATTDHGNQPLFLVVVQHLCRARPWPLVECPFQAPFLITMPNLANGLWSERDRVRDSGRAYTLGQLQQCPRRAARPGPVACRGLASLG